MKSSEIKINKTTIIILVVLFCALFLRIHNFNKYDLWFDEMGSDTISARYVNNLSTLSDIPKWSIIRDKLDDPHSPLYYLCIYVYSHFFGDGTYLRLFSAIMSILTLLLFYKFSRLFFDRCVSIIAFTLMSFNPFHIWYAQEARGYTLISFLSLLMVYIFLKAVKKNKLHYWLLFPFVSVLAILSSYHASFLFITTGLIFLFKNYHTQWRKWLFSTLIVLIFFFFISPLIFNQIDFVKNYFWLNKPTIKIHLFTWMIFNLGYSATLLQYRLSLSLFFILFAYGTYSSWKTNRQKTITLLLFLFLSIITTFVFSHIFMPIYLHRQLIIVTPFYFLLIAKGLESIPQKFIHTALVGCITILLSISLYNYHHGFMFDQGRNTYLLGGTFPKKNYKGLLDEMSTSFKEGDLIATTDLQSHIIASLQIIKYYDKFKFIPSTMYRFLFYPQVIYPEDGKSLGIDKQIKNIHEHEKDKLFSLSLPKKGQVEIQKADLDSSKFKRIWLISSSWVNEDPGDHNSLLIKDYTDKNFKKIWTKQKDGVRIDLYSLEDPRKTLQL